MREQVCDVLVVGGGTGGCAAVMAAVGLGMSVVLTEETDWIGGQLTAQAVPPDEHPWIENFGCTARYRRYRETVRAIYRDRTPLKAAFRDDPKFNPGNGWVSRLCHDPLIGWLALNEMLLPALASGRLSLLLNTVPVGGTVLSIPGTETGTSTSNVVNDRVEAVELLNLGTGQTLAVRARYVIDATELGDLLSITGADYVSGAESKQSTGEPHAIDGPAEPENVQGLTWCMALALDEGSRRVIDKPERYEFWREYQAPFWPGKQLGFLYPNPATGETRHLPFLSADFFNLMQYRQVVDPARFEDGYTPHPATIANWPQNDYFEENIIDKSAAHIKAALDDARNLSLSVLYWLQTEAPRHDGGVGYPGAHLRGDLVGTQDGFAKTPYIRESRRIVARKTVCEQDVATYTNAGCDRAPSVTDSVGIGSYRIDLHPSTNGRGVIDTSSLPFQIPLGSLIPIRMRNLIPGAKNLGVTHITNGCYRVHPVEWNIGESAGALAAFCVQKGIEPAAVYESAEFTSEFQGLLCGQGIELEWPRLRGL